MSIKLVRTPTYNELQGEIHRLRRELEGLTIHLGAIAANNGGRIEIPNVLLFQDYELTITTDNSTFSTVVEVEDR